MRQEIEFVNFGRANYALRPCCGQTVSSRPVNFVAGDWVFSGPVHEGSSVHQMALGQALQEYIYFVLPLSFHQCSILIFA